MNIVIFDSEPKHAEYMKQVLARITGEELQIQCNPALQAAISLAEDKDGTTLFFIDTRLKPAGGNFLMLARKLRECSDTCHICFTSPSLGDMAYCYKKLVRPSGFFIKPADEEELGILISEIKAFEGQKRSTRDEERIVLKNRGVQKILRMNDVLYFTSVDKKIFCHTVDEEEICFYGALGKIEEEYGEYLLRCHSGFLVNRKRIEGFSKNSMSIRIRGTKEDVPVSKSRCKSVEAFVNGVTLGEDVE